MTEKEVKLAIMYFAICQLQIETIDQLRHTKLYDSNDVKRLKKIQDSNIRMLNAYFSELDNETSIYFNKSVSMIETFLSVTKSQDIDLLMMYMEEFRKGNIIVVEDEQHSN